MEVLVDSEPDLVAYDEQLTSSKIDLGNITETAQDIEQNLDDPIKNCEATVISGYNIDENGKGLENRMYNFSVVSNSESPLNSDSVQERKDNGKACQNKESIVNEIIQFFEKVDNNADAQDASLSDRSEDVVKEDSWMMSDNVVEQDCVKKTQTKCWNLASSAADNEQLGLSNDGAPQMHESPTSVRLGTSAGSEFICCDSENILGKNSDKQENGLLEKLHAELSSLDPQEEDKKLILPKKEVNAIGNPKGSVLSNTSHLELAFSMASEASLGDVGKEKTVQTADKYDYKEMHRTQEHTKETNSEYMDIHDPIQCSVVKSMSKVECMPQVEGISGCLNSEDNFTDTDVCKETQVSSTTEEYMNSHCRFLKGDKGKLISSLGKALCTEEREQSTVEIYACSVVLDKINLQQQNTDVSLQHKAMEKQTTNIMPVQILFPLDLPITSKPNVDNEGSTDSVEKNEPCGVGLFKCPLCIKSYSHKRSLNKHKRRVHPDYWRQETSLSPMSGKKIVLCKYKCDKCPFRFFSKAGLIRHQNKSCSMNLTVSSEEKKMITSHSNQIIKGKEAQVLDYKYGQLKPLRQNVFSLSNVKSLSGEEKTNICRFCGRMISRKSNLVQHEQMHIRKKLNFVKSEAEHESFTSASQTGHSSASQNDHSAVNSDGHSDAANQHKCKFCGRMFSRRSNLVQHEQVHKTRKQTHIFLDKTYTVESCDKKRSGGSGKNTFKTSVVQISHKCRFCSRKFFRRCNLCQHERVCRRRQNSQKQKHKISSRTKTHNSSSKKVSVSVVKSSLRIISNNICQYCRKNFSSRSNLNRHVKLHKQKKNFLKQKNNGKRSGDTFCAKTKMPESIREKVSIISTDQLAPYQHVGKWFNQQMDCPQKGQLLEQGNTNNSSSVKSNFHIDNSESGQNIKKENISKTDHICRFCGRNFARRINLCQHERVCQRRLVFHKQKSANSSKARILSSSVSPTENPLGVISNSKFNRCQYCNKCYSTKSNLKRHVKLHEQKKKFLKQKNERKRIDESLNTERKSSESIGNLVQIDSPDNWHTCQHCGKWFPRKLDLSKHLKFHNQKYTQLKHENADGSSAAVTNFHTETSESGQIIKKENINKTEHICRSCGRLFGRRINLCQHERVCQRRLVIDKQKSENRSRTKIHNSSIRKVSFNSFENPLGVIANNKFNRCQYCKKFYSSRSNLKRHVKLHKQKKKFLQQKNDSKRIDDNLYTQTKSPEFIRNREQNISSDDWHTCQHCGKCFSQMLDLSQHLKLHSQEFTHLEQRNTDISSSPSTDLHTDNSESGQNIKKENINKTEHICRSCGRHFGRRINLCQHERVCQRRLVIHKQKSENSSRTKIHNSSIRKVSFNSFGNPLGVIANNKCNRCQYCKKFYSSKSNLNRHVKLHKQKKKFLHQKNDSKRTDETKRKLFDSIRNQVNMISSDNQHPCLHCGRRFVQKMDLSQHLKLCNQESMQLEYGNTVSCSSSITTDLHNDTSESKQNIMKENVKNTGHICRYCGRLFARRFNLCQHEKLHKQKGENNKNTSHICRICGRHFERRVNLCQHERSHSQKNGYLYMQKMVESKSFQAKGQYRCQVCKITCPNKSDLLLHYESRHAENLMCQICNTLLGTDVHLRKHMRTHVEFSMVDVNEMSHCKRKKYTNAAHFHKKTKDGKRSRVAGKSCNIQKSKKYKCMTCGISFNCNSLLFLHKKEHEMSPHACFVCGKIFVRKFDLARHLRIHTGDQPYECTICLKGFRCRFTLVEHMGTHVVMEANEFQCAGCKALFFDRESILNHLESSHTSHHHVSNLEPQIIYNDDEMQGHASGRENMESDSVTNYIPSKMPTFSCGICGEIYEEVSRLFLHMGNHVNESVEILNSNITVKSESCSPNRQLDSYQQLCKLENNLSHNDMQQSNGYLCMSDFVDTMKQETVVNEISSLHGERKISDHTTERHSSGYVDVGLDDGVDPSESVSEFSNDLDEITISNVANFGDKTKIFRELNKWFKCGQCMNMYSSKQGLSQHLRWHASTDVKFNQMKKEYCTTCKIYFASKSRFKMHLNWHKSGQGRKVVISDKISIPLKPYSCEKCGKTFTRKDGLANHKCMMHYSQDEQGSKSRGNVVISKGAFKKSLVPNGFTCEVCGCSYAQRACLVQHLLHKHNLAEKNFEEVYEEKDKPFKCQLFQNNTGLPSQNTETSRKPMKIDVPFSAKSYSCTSTDELNMVSPARVGSYIFSSPFPRQIDAVALDHEAVITETHNEKIWKNEKKVTNLISLEEFPVPIKQEPVDLCDSVCGSTCTSPVKEVENNAIDACKLQESSSLNRVVSNRAKFDLSPSVQLNENAEQDDIQRDSQDSGQDGVDDFRYRNSSPVDRSDVLHFIRSPLETGQNDSLTMLKGVFEKPYSEAQGSSRNLPDPVKAAYVNDTNDFGEQQESTEMEESSDKNDIETHCCTLPNNSEEGIDLPVHSHHQKLQIHKDDETGTSGINQESKEEQIQCIICCKMVYSKELVGHMQSHADLKLYECRHCNECFLSAVSYSEHLEKNYGEIVCFACGETFSDKTDLTMHVKKHNFDVIQNCNICGAVFTCHQTFSKHVEFHVISEIKSAETQNDSSDDNRSKDIEIIAAEDRELEENLRTLLEDQGDEGMTVSSVITSSLAAWNQMSPTLLSESSIKVDRRDDIVTEIIDNPGKKDTASSEDSEVPDIKPDINKLRDMLMQNTCNNMESIMGHKQTILDKTDLNSPYQARAEHINTFSGTPLNWNSDSRCQNEHFQVAPSTSADSLPVRTELREPEKVPVIKKEFVEQDIQALIEESERPNTCRTELVQPGLKPCCVKLKKINYKILTCVFCLRILVTKNALERHYLLHLIPEHKFS